MFDEFHLWLPTLIGLGCGGWNSNKESWAQDDRKRKLTMICKCGNATDPASAGSREPSSKNGRVSPEINRIFQIISSRIWDCSCAPGGSNGKINRILIKLLPFGNSGLDKSKLGGGWRITFQKAPPTKTAKTAALRLDNRCMPCHWNQISCHQKSLVQTLESQLNRRLAGDVKEFGSWMCISAESIRSLFMSISAALWPKFQFHSKFELPPWQRAKPAIAALDKTIQSGNWSSEVEDSSSLFCSAKMLFFAFAAAQQKIILFFLDGKA